MTDQQQEAEIREALEQYGKVLTKEAHPGNWICKVTDNGNRTLFTTAGYPSPTKLIAMQRCASAIEESLQAGSLDDLPEEAPLTNIVALSIEEQETEVLERLERYGTIRTTEVEPANWVCEVSGGPEQYKVGGGGDDGLFLTRLSALKWCLRALENTFDGGYFDTPSSKGVQTPSM